MSIEKNTGLSNTSNNFLLIAISIILSLFLAELLAITYFKASGQEIRFLPEIFIDDGKQEMLFDSELGFKLRPHYKDYITQINSMGFRSFQEFDFNNSQKRLLLLGDSMVYGFNIPQKYIFSEILNREYPECLFVNTAVEGYDTTQEYIMMKRFVDKINPVAVILFYTQSNDMWLNARSINFHPKAVLNENKLYIEQVKKREQVPFYKKLYLYGLLDKKFLIGKDFLYLKQYLDFNVRKENSYVWKVTRSILSRIGGIARDKKITVIIIDIPTTNQMIKSSMSRLRQNLLKKASEEEGFLYYDLDTQYPDDWQGLFLEDRSHWNEKGHRFIANFMKKVLTEHNFL